TRITTAPTSRHSVTRAGLWCVFRRERGIFYWRAGFPALFALSKASQAAYNQFMANGSESKSMEEQQADQQEQIRSQEIVDEKERLDRLKAEVTRKMQALKMTRARIC